MSEDTQHGSLERMRQLVETVMKSFVDDEDAVEVSVRPQTNLPDPINGELETVQPFQVKVAPDDYRKAIGRNGQNIEAFRFILRAAGYKFGLPRCTIFVLDPARKTRPQGGGGGPRKPRPHYPWESRWNR